MKDDEPMVFRPLDPPNVVRLDDYRLRRYLRDVEQQLRRAFGIPQHILTPRRKF